MLATLLALRGQTNFIKMLWKFNGIYNPARLAADHMREVRYEILLPSAPTRPSASWTRCGWVRGSG